MISSVYNVTRMQHAQPAYYELYNSYFPTFALYPLDYIVGRGPSSMRNFEGFWADLGQALHSEFGKTIMIVCYMLHLNKLKHGVSESVSLRTVQIPKMVCAKDNA